MSGRPTLFVPALIVVVAAAIALAPAVWGQGTHWDRTGDRPAARVPQGVGTVQYDPGAPADTFLSGGPANAASYLNGNRFDTRNGQPLSAGTITGISWYQGADPANFAGVVVGPIGGVPVFAVSYDPLPNTFNAISPVIPIPPSFFAGLALSPVASFGSIGARSATYAGGGFHGLQQSFSGGTTNQLTNLNVMVRVTGSMVIPVELTEFEVE